MTSALPRGIEGGRIFEGGSGAGRPAPLFFVRRPEGVRRNRLVLGGFHPASGHQGREPMGLGERLEHAGELLREFYEGRHRGALARERREEDDLFMLLVFSEMMGIPNPASYYTLELLPLLYEGFHDWHTRMGMERSPLEGFRCC